MTADDAVTAKYPLGESTLHIPPSPRPWADYSDRIRSLLADAHTHVYFDTSFLMWLTKIGAPSRTQLFAWLSQSNPDRLHVPIWAAHEYLKHYTKRTVLEDFTNLRKEVQSFARRTYDRLRPFIDEPVGMRADDPATVRTNIRKALNTLHNLLHDAGAWKTEYQSHTTAVLEFINGHTPNSSSTYTDLGTVSTYAHSRLAGAVPPGFKDLWKNRKPPSTTEDSTPPPGANTYGDLLLWKEILSHAKSVGATAIVLITNDLKNDWQMGHQTNESPKDPELLAIRKSWKPVPRPHPMLLFEARNNADVSNVELIDSIYLGVYLKQVAQTDASDFIDVAISPESKEADDPSASEPSAPTTDGTETALDPALTDEGFLFDDPPKVQNSHATLRIALLQSRQPLAPPSKHLLDSWIDQQSKGSPSWQIDAAALADVDHTHFVAAARTLHERALNQHPGSIETLADLATNIERLPPNSAAATYFGLLASMFLQQPDNEPRIPPNSKIAAQLLALRRSHFARHAITVISRHLHRAQERSLYVPTNDPRPLSIVFDTDSDLTPPGQLASMRVHTNEDLPAFPVELLIPAKINPELHLGSIFGSGTIIDAKALIDKAATIYAFPTDSINIADGSHSNSFVIPDALSFRDPRDLRIQQET